MSSLRKEKESKKVNDMSVNQPERHSRVGSCVGD